VSRNGPPGSKCKCDPLFEGFEWYELTSIRAKDLPSRPGVYIIRVVERGCSVREAIKYFNEILGRTEWKEFLKYVDSRLERLRRISACPVIYIGSTTGLKGGKSSSIRTRYKDLAGRRHTVFFPILALLLAKWKLCFGFITVENHKKAKEIERKLKEEYRKVHDKLPALVKK